MSFKEGVKYKVIKAYEDDSELNIKIGDICSFVGKDQSNCLWFHCETWLDDGIWCLDHSDVEEFK